MNLVEAEILALFSDETNGINKDVTPGDPKIIKTFYQGEVKVVPRSYLPALMVFGTRTEQPANGTAKDLVKFDIVVRVVIDAVTEFTEAGNGGILQIPFRLREIMEDRDETGKAKDTSVLGILRGNIRGTNFLYTTDSAIEYTTLQTNGFFYTVAELKTQAVDRALRR